MDGDGLMARTDKIGCQMWCKEKQWDTRCQDTPRQHIICGAPTPTDVMPVKSCAYQQKLLEGLYGGYIVLLLSLHSSLTLQPLALLQKLGKCCLCICALLKSAKTHITFNRHWHFIHKLMQQGDQLATNFISQPQAALLQSMCFDQWH